MKNAAERSAAAAIECFAAGHVRGSVIRPHIDWVRDHCDRLEVIEFFHEIRPAMRAVSTAAWYAFEDLIVLDRVIVGRFGACMDDIGRYAARHNLGRTQPALTNALVHPFLQRSALRHHEEHDFGNAVYRQLDAAGGQFRRNNWTSFSPLYCATTLAFFRESIHLLGGVGAEVWESECQCRGDESCTFELMWS